MTIEAKNAIPSLVTLDDPAYPPESPHGLSLKDPFFTEIGSLKEKISTRKTAHGLVVLETRESQMLLNLESKLATLRRLNVNDLRGEPTQRQVLSQRAVAVGISMLIEENLGQQHALMARGVQRTERVIPATEETPRLLFVRLDALNVRWQLTHFAYAGELVTPIEGVTLLSLKGVQDDSEDPQKLASYFRFFTVSHLIAGNYPDDDFPLEDSDDPSFNRIMKEFPSITSHNRRISASRVCALVDLPLEDMENIAKTSSGTKHDAALLTLPFMRHAQALSRQIYQALYDPDSKAFPYIKDAIASYQMIGEFPELAALQTAGIFDKENIISFFRKAQAYVAQKHHEANFFQTINQAIIRSIRKLEAEGKTIGLVLAEALPATLTQASPEAVPAVFELKQLAQQIFKDGQKSGYSLDPKLLDSTPFPLTTLTIRNNNKESSYELTFKFVADDGKTREIILTIKDDFFDWNIFDAPDSLPQWRDTFLVFAKKALLVLQSAGESKLPISMEEAHGIIFVQSTEQRKPKRSRQLAPPTTEPETRKNKPPSRRQKPEKTRPRTSIVVPEKPRWERMTGGLSHGEQRMVNRVLARLKKTSLHGLKGLASQRNNGKLTYEVTVTTQLRLVLEEVASANGGAPHFQVVDIRRS